MSALFSFGEWLKQRRSALLLSRDQLAQKVGCAEVTLRKIEADERRPSLPIAERLADLLELRADERTLFLQVARGLASAERLPPPIPRGAAVPAPPAPSLPAPLARPSGTVTFLFTDIVGSTQLWEQQPDAMRAALARHDGLLRAGIVAHSGAVVKSSGDGMLAAFARATDAVHAALAAQRALYQDPWNEFTQVDSSSPNIQNRNSKIELRVRMALHSGVTEERDGDYFGPSLNRVARLLAAGHGGQILLSLATAELVREQLPPDADLRDLGAHRLKDLSRPEQIFQLVTPDLPTDFPPLNTLDARRTNLPAQPTTLIGREQEVATVCALLRRPDVRLVTLTGPGGTGKTRLGLQAAAELADPSPVAMGEGSQTPAPPRLPQRERGGAGHFLDGVYFVNLAPISDATLVVSAITQMLGLTESGDQPLLNRLQVYLRDKRLLLLLDNFEQIVDAAPVVAELLAGCPQLKLLVTSRVPLHLRGEKEFAVSPLALPPNLPRSRGWERGLGGEGDLTQYAAVQLFIQRALDVQPSFAVTNDNAPAVAEICLRLDGLPLAIELAAARIKLFAPEALLARLSNRLALLTGGARDLPQRQQTLRNAIAWSYDLLTPAQQRLFRRLAVFVGGWTLASAESVCSIDSDLGLIVLDGMQALVDNSLVRQEEGLDGAPRFRPLETIREYAVEQLAASGEAEVLLRRHAAHYLALAEAAEPHLHGRERGTWLDRLEVEHDNLRAALRWALAAGDVETGARITIALAGQDWHGLWSKVGYWGEGWRWLEAVLTQRDALTPRICAWVLLLAATYRGMLAGNPFLAQLVVLDEALAIFRAVGDRSGIAYVRCYQGIGLRFGGGYAVRGMPLLEEALALYQEIGDHYHSTTVIHHLGCIARDHGDVVRAVALLDQSLAMCRKRGYINEIPRVLNDLGDIACIQGDLPQATARYWEALLLVEDEKNDLTRVWLLLNLTWLALVQGDDGRVLALMQQQVEWFREQASLSVLIGMIPALGALVNAQGDSAQATAILRDGVILQQQFAEQDVLIESLEAFAGVAVGQGWMVRAARLLAAAEALRTMIGVRRLPSARPAYERHVATARAQLDDAAFAAAWAAGQALTLEKAIAEALGEGDQAVGVL